MSVDIFNRPPSISDDTLHYTLHFPAAQSSPSKLSSVAALILEYVNDTLLPKDFLWHRDAFELRLGGSRDNGKGKGKAREGDVMKEGDVWLEGTVRVGDAVDDEWCIVWLLREVSKRWDCVISVVDSDGQFLLIECADSLPSWVTPSNAENRVWIYRSELHLVPLSHTSPASTRARHRPSRTNLGQGSDDEDDMTDEESWISTPDALRLVRDEDVRTVAPPSVQAALGFRLSRYPSSLPSHIHHTLAYLPAPIALALSRSPSLVQRATEAFYTRDALQLRSAHKMTRFPPQPSVLTKVTLTRVAYAQLSGQRWTAPKVFGSPPRGEREKRRWDVGVRISAGFEMLFQETRGRANLASSQAGNDARMEALQRDPAYTAYVASLRKAGYFGQEIEGSQKWKEREENAVLAYVNARASENATRPSFASLVETALKEPVPSIEQIEASPDTPEDDESWLSVDQSELESMLARTSAGGSGPGANSGPSGVSDEPKITELRNGEDADVDMEERAAQREADRLREMARKVEEFVEGRGEVEGATFPDDILEDNDQLDEDLGDSDDESDADVDMEMDPAQREEAMSKLVQPLGDGEYGQMPPDWQRPPPMSDTALVEAAASALNKPDGKGKERAEPDDLEPLDMSSGHRAPLFGRDQYEGHSSDSELDEAGQGLSDSEEEGEDAPIVVGEMDVEPDMENEEADFLAFARKELGISEEGWMGIVKEREGAGRFVPKSAGAGGAAAGNETPKEEEEPSGTYGPPRPPNPSQSKSKSKSKSQPKPKPGASENSGQKAVHFKDPASAPSDRSATRTRVPQAGPRPNANPNLDSFERVMEAMEAELAKAKAEKAGASQSGKGKGKASAATAKGKSRTSAIPEKDRPEAREGDGEEEDEDDLVAAMDAELRNSLRHGEGDDGDSEEDGAPIDYNLIKNFLESFKSQAGLAGPVSGMVGRLDKGWAWPRDEGAA